jgi:hypothetical protein
MTCPSDLRENAINKPGILYIIILINLYLFGVLLDLPYLCRHNYEYYN